MKIKFAVFLICLQAFSSCSKKQALFQSSTYEESLLVPNAELSHEFTPINIEKPKKIPDFSEEKLSTNKIPFEIPIVKIHRDTIFPKIDTIAPKTNVLDSILIPKTNKLVIQEADKLAKKAHDLGVIGLVVSWLFFPFGIVFGLMAISKGKKALKFGTTQVKQAKNAIILGKILVGLFVFSILVMVIMFYLLISFLAGF
jgi:hypothetical protein